jgi:tRNA (cmo5U34)-methyltransferase
MTTSHSAEVARHFKNEWKDYDRQIRTVIPFYDQALETLIGVLRRSRHRPKSILDLGIGTGNLAHLLLTGFPDAHLTGIDIVKDFLDMAAQRLSVYHDRISLRLLDVTDFGFEDTYDLIVTSFMVHHLTNNAKKVLYSQILSSLAPSGCFINADFVHSGSTYYGEVFDELRVAFMRQQGVSEDAIQKQYTEHRKLEMPVPMETQLDWLRQLGFSDVECFWKYLNLAVFGGRKLD